MENDNDKQQMTESPIGVAELEAVKLRFEGYSYPEISLRIKEVCGQEFKEGTLRNWFYRGGKLYELYKDYVKSETEVRRAVSIDLFKAHLDDAVKTLFTLMAKSKSDMIKLLAAKEIINRELGEPKKVIQAEVSNPAREILEGAGLLNDGKEDTEDN